MLTRANDAVRAEPHRRGRRASTRAIIAKRPDTEDAYRKLALVYWRSDRPRLAIETLETALRNGVTQSEVRIKLGQYLGGVGPGGQGDRAVEGIAGTDPDALIALGNAYMVAGRNRRRVRTFRRLLELDPGNALAYQNLGMAQLQAEGLQNGGGVAPARGAARSVPRRRLHRAGRRARQHGPNGRSD